MYAPVFVSPSDYAEVRLALGLLPTDTDVVADEVILGRGYLPFVERAVGQEMDDAAAVKAAGGDRAATLVDGVVMATAARVARYWLGARRGDEVDRVVVGPYTTQYRSGVDWDELAEHLAREAAQAFALVETWGSPPARVTIIGRTGPTRDAEDRDLSTSITHWRRLLWPPPVKGYVHDDQSSSL